MRILPMFVFKSYDDSLVSEGPVTGFITGVRFTVGEVLLYSPPRTDRLLDLVGTGSLFLTDKAVGS
jgi:hypothetical protein